LNKVAFYIDGSVNGGNSGGPIVDFSDGKIIGIVTQRRFLGGQDLNQLQKAAKQLRDHCQQIAGRGSVQIMGIGFGGFSSLKAEAMLLA
jgi:S1-C subfamily serine protease